MHSLWNCLQLQKGKPGCLNSLTESLQNMIIFVWWTILKMKDYCKNSSSILIVCVCVGDGGAHEKYVAPSGTGES